MARRQRKTISEQLRRAIRARGQSLCQIAEGCGIDDARLSRFMRGQRGMTTKTLDRLCAYLRLELRESKRKGR